MIMIIMTVNMIWISLSLKDNKTYKNNYKINHQIKKKNLRNFKNNISDKNLLSIQDIRSESELVHE